MTDTKLTVKDKLAMYRNAFYSLMGARETLPTDRQCLAWLKQVSDQAQYKTNPRIGIVAHEPQFVQASRIVPQIEIRQWDVVVPLPDWTDLPR
jgi:hypothetical protein